MLGMVRSRILSTCQKYQKSQETQWEMKPKLRLRISHELVTSDHPDQHTNNLQGTNFKESPVLTS